MKIENTEQMLAMTMMSSILKQSMGNSQSFDIILQGLLQSMDSSSIDSQSILSGLLGNQLGESIGGSSSSLSDLNTLNLKSYLSQGVDSAYKGTDATRLRIETAVKSASQKYGVDENLIRAVIKQESDFNPKVVSSAGAQGLMQLMPFNSEAYGLSNPYDIEGNINVGTQMLKKLIDRYGNLDMALMGYNAGEGTMAKRGVTSPSDLYKMPAETRNYVVKVTNYYKNGIS